MCLAVFGVYHQFGKGLFLFMDVVHARNFSSGKLMTKSLLSIFHPRKIVCSQSSAFIFLSDCGFGRSTGPLFVFGQKSTRCKAVSGAW